VARPHRRQVSPARQVTRNANLGCTTWPGAWTVEWCVYWGVHYVDMEMLQEDYGITSSSSTSGGGTGARQVEGEDPGESGLRDVREP
jgi:hypothetical protein